MTPRQILLVCIAVSLPIGGCSRADLMKRMVPSADEKFARERTELLRQKRFEQIEHELDPSLSDAEETLKTMAAMFPAEEPKSIKVVDMKFLWNQGFSTHSLTLEYEFSDSWLLANIAVKRFNGLSTITAFNVTPIADSLENINRFGLVGKSPLQYFTLALAVAGPIFCLYALVLCLRTKDQNFKWLWTISILFGITKFAVNWTTGEWTFTPLAWSIPCATVSAVPAYGPWVITVSFPLGALLFMARRRANATPNQLQSPQEVHKEKTSSPIASETTSRNTATKAP